MAEAQTIPDVSAQGDNAHRLVDAIISGATSGVGLTTPVWITWFEVRIGLAVALSVGVYWAARAGCQVIDLVRKWRS